MKMLSQYKPVGTSCNTEMMQSNLLNVLGLLNCQMLNRLQDSFAKLFSYHRICLIDHVVTVLDLERQTSNNCYEGSSLPGAGHVSFSVRGGDMDITGCRPEDSGSLSYEMPATDLRYSLDRPHQQRDYLITPVSRQLASKLLAIASQSLAIFPD